MTFRELMGDWPQDFEMVIAVYHGGESVETRYCDLPDWIEWYDVTEFGATQRTYAAGIVRREGPETWPPEPVWGHLEPGWEEKILPRVPRGGDMGGGGEDVDL